MARTKVRRAAESRLVKQLGAVSSAMLARLLEIDHSAANGMALAGCPRKDDGTFDWFAVVRWLKREGRGIFRPAAAPTATDDRATLDRYKALTARAEYEERVGKLIARDDAMRAQMRLALEFKASLLALPEQLAMALANLPSREVEAVLRERVEWILGRSQDGVVPIPKSLVDAIAKLVAEHLPPHPAEAPAT